MVSWSDRRSIVFNKFFSLDQVFTHTKFFKVCLNLFFNFDIVVSSFVFDKHYPIMD